MIKLEKLQLEVEVIWMFGEVIQQINVLVTHFMDVKEVVEVLILLIQYNLQDLELLKLSTLNMEE